MLSELATLFEGGHTTDTPRASYLLSMVFKIRYPRYHIQHI